MGNIIMTGLLGIFSVLFASTSAETAQAPPWTTAVKISCDRSVAQADASNVLLCEDATCKVFFLAGGFDCGSNLGLRSVGHRFDTTFKPTVFNYALQVSDQSARMMCSNAGDGIPVGTTITCDGSKSPKLTVGRPH